MVAENPEVLDLVARMRREAFSRNRNFQQFSCPEGASAMRVWRFLRSIEADLRAAREAGPGQFGLSVERLDLGARRIILELRPLGLLRVATLSAAEYALLLEDQDAKAALEAAERA